MSRENVEVVRAAWALAARQGPEGMLDFLDSDVEWEVRSDLPDSGRYRGHEGFLKLVGRFDEAFEEQGYEPVDFIDAGERVVVPLRWWGRGRTSGATVTERHETWVFTVSGRLVTAVEEFSTRAEALEAVGLRE
jgi:ketosteroid isomerase-like protein